MKTGTKSVLFGAHCFFIHPFFVFWAWWRLFGFPWDPRLWFAFFVHDLGYLGCEKMDDEKGEWHVELGARIMGYLFDSPFGKSLTKKTKYVAGRDWPFGVKDCLHVNGTWYCFSFYHSRFMCRRYGHQPTRLCVADKLAVGLEPWWLYLPRVIASGEIREYMDLHNDPNSKYGGERKGATTQSKREWFRRMSRFCRNWAMERKHGPKPEDVPFHPSVSKVSRELETFIGASDAGTEAPE